MRSTVGIIGFGRFGQLLASILAADFDVAVFDTRPNRQKAENLGVAVASLRQCASMEVVILAVPISGFDKAIRRIVPFLRKGVLVMDVCSVKEYPLKIMKRLLPPYVEFLATHPLFGPDSYLNEASRNWVFCNFNRLSDKQVKWKAYVESGGFNVILSAASAHDMAMAYSVNLPHLIGRALEKTNFKPYKMGTQNSQKLAELMKSAINDSLKLFQDIHRYNRYAKAIEMRFIKNLRGLMEK